MALEFRPPQDLINGYLNRPSPGQEASAGIQQALQMYAQQKQQEQQNALQKQQLASLDSQRKATEFGAVAPYTPEAQIPDLAKNYGINIPPAGGVPPVASTGTVPTAGMPDASGNPAMQGQLPSLIERFQNRKPTSKFGREQYAKDLNIQKTERDLATDPNAPVPVMSKGAAIKAGSVDPRTMIVEPPTPPQQRPPQGYRFKTDGNLEAIPGGPVAAKTAGLQNATISNANSTIAKVDQALGNISGWSTGWGAKVFGGLPRTDARTLGSDIETIKANLAFATLQEMRRQSPTGGALGSVSERELSLLESSVANLDPTLDSAILQRNLNEVKTHYQNWKDAVLQSSSGQDGMAQPQSTQFSDDEEAEYQAWKAGQR